MSRLAAPTPSRARQAAVCHRTCSHPLLVPPMQHPPNYSIKHSAFLPFVQTRRRSVKAELLHQAFGFSAFRANQEAVCKSVIQGRDVLLVMPTGAGKSLCYQLPGIARGGTTLVI